VSPITHLLGSWVVAAVLTDNPRDRRLVTLAGVLPDLDGLGLLIDLPNRLLGRPETSYYAQYHHFLLHGLCGALALAGLATLLARRRARVALAALVVVHLHLLCDLAGSRGPSLSDLWPVYYFAPFSVHPMWVWKGQWRLDGGINRLIAVVLLGWALALAVRRGDSFVGVFNRRADAVFVGVLQKWHRSLLAWRLGRGNLPSTREG
jgi:inner membrane protein